MRVTASSSCLTLVPCVIVLSIATEDVASVRAQAVNRTVYVTVTDGKGAPVPDLTPANFKVKEGGKDREIVKAEPAKARPHIALMVEERLAPDTQTRVGLFEFVKRINGAAEISLITVGLRNTTIVPYVTDPNTLLKAINELSLNPQPTSNLTEGINDIARIFEQQRPERPVIVVVGLSGGQAGGASASSILTQLRQSGAMLYSVTYGPPGTNNSGNLGTMGDESGREQVLGDGAKQSGARRLDVVSTSAISKALQQIADDLAAQYVITYALPGGVKPDRRFSITTDRKGISLRAPSALPDR
jgi:Ca-activated chloride channel family protein